MAAKFDMQIDQGSDYTAILKLYSDEAKTMPLDLTGSVLRGQIRSWYDKPLIAEFVITVRNQVTDLGIADLLLPADQTKGLVLKCTTKFVYDIEMEDAGGFVTRLFGGFAIISPEVTKDV